MVTQLIKQPTKCSMLEDLSDTTGVLDIQTRLFIVRANLTADNEGFHQYR